MCRPDETGQTQAGTNRRGTPQAGFRGRVVAGDKQRKTAVPIDNAQLEQMISTGFTVGAALAAWWKNNSFTPEAIEADAFMARMKKRVR